MVSNASSSSLPSESTRKNYGQIQLIDHTLEGDSGAQTPTSISHTRSSDLNLSLTRTSLREQVARRKYGKWQQQPQPQDNGQGPSRNEIPEDQIPTTQEPSLPTEESRLRRGRAKIKNYINPQAAQKRTSSATTALDILYENRRGAFIFGLPLFSSNSLLNFDPPPWQNQQFHQSPVDITNAQLPDPGWEWDWPRWYVDMSRDVDEEGWEYSFKLGGRFAWHGNANMLCSFVRRRRWVRRRVRRTEVKNGKGEEGHGFNADYFTINTGKESRRSSPSKEEESRMAPAAWKGKEDVEEEEDITTIATLMKVLRKSSVDRQKILAVQTFLAHGTDDLYYLADEMPHILSLLLYQSSRRQLLAAITAKIDELHEAAHHDQESGSPSPDEPQQSHSENVQKQVDALHKALETADAQVKHLEYWSDIRDLARHGDTVNPFSEAYSGVGTSGPGESEAFSGPATPGNKLDRGVSFEEDVFVDAPSEASSPQPQEEDNGETGEDEGEGKGKEEVVVAEGEGRDARVGEKEKEEDELVAKWNQFKGKGKGKEVFGEKGSSDETFRTAETQFGSSTS